jgi:hypothetical protein
VWSLKRERWGLPLVQGKYREGKACDKRHPCRIMVIIDERDVMSHLLYFRTSVCMIWDFSRAVNQIVALLGCYAAWSGSYRRFGVIYIILLVLFCLVWIFQFWLCLFCGWV